MTNMELIEAVPAQTTLWYFDGRGLAHMIRYMLAATNEPYVERFVKDKQTMDSLREAGLLVWNQIPLLQIDGLNLVQVRSFSAIPTEFITVFITHDLCAVYEHRT
eukprot:Colp12_sorted_trinity150504_noHs@224